MKHFYDLAELPAEQVAELLMLSRRLRERPEPRALEGKVLSLLFLSPSLRTVASFQAAMSRLGGGSFVISPESAASAVPPQSGIVMEGRAAEHFRDAIPVLDAYGDAIGVRAFAGRQDLNADLEDRTYREISGMVKNPMINLESAAFHPCQSLADWKTLDELSIPARGKLVLSWAFHPKALPLSGPTSTLQMAAMRGMHVVVLRPDGFALPASVMQRAATMAAMNGGSVRETSDKNEAMTGANILYVKEWASSQHYGDWVREEKLRLNHTDWCATEHWFKDASRDCRLMHSMPVRRGVAIDDQLLDGPRSALIQQASNRMWTQMALLHRMLGAAQ